MSYDKAREAFDENLKRYLNAQNDPVAWNLSAGLSQLAEALRMDMHEMRRKLGDIEARLRLLEGSKRH